MGGTHIFGPFCRIPESKFCQNWAGGGGGRGWHNSPPPPLPGSYAYDCMPLNHHGNYQSEGFRLYQLLSYLLLSLQSELCIAKCGEVYRLDFSHAQTNGSSSAALALHRHAFGDNFHTLKYMQNRKVDYVQA